MQWLRNELDELGMTTVPFVLATEKLISVSVGARSGLASAMAATLLCIFNHDLEARVNEMREETGATANRNAAYRVHIKNDADSAENFLADLESFRLGGQEVDA